MNMDLKEKIIYVDNKPHIKCGIVMLSSDKKSDLRIVRGYDGNPLCYDLLMDSVQLHNNRNSTISYQHLYFTSNEEIKEGNFYLKPDDNNIWVRSKNSNIITIGSSKIIATTDTSLIYLDKTPIGENKNGLWKQLPQPSQQFIEKYIEEYNKGNIITEILVEIGYVDHDLALFRDELSLKLDSQNQITIRKQKDSWNREDISKLVIKLKSLSKENQLKIINSVESFDKWIEENL